jgi:hypothetical protein
MECTKASGNIRKSVIRKKLLDKFSVCGTVHRPGYILLEAQRHTDAMYCLL